MLRPGGAKGLGTGARGTCAHASLPRSTAARGPFGCASATRRLGDAARPLPRVLFGLQGTASCGAWAGRRQEGRPSKPRDALYRCAQAAHAASAAMSRFQLSKPPTGYPCGYRSRQNVVDKKIFWSLLGQRLSSPSLRQSQTHFYKMVRLQHPPLAPQPHAAPHRRRRPRSGPTRTAPCGPRRGGGERDAATAIWPPGALKMRIHRGVRPPGPHRLRRRFTSTSLSSATSMPASRPPPVT